MNAIQKKIQYLLWLQQVGVDYYCSTEPANIALLQQFCNLDQAKMNNRQNAETATAKQHNSVKKSSAMQVDDLSPKAQARALADSANNLQELQENLLKFDGCGLKEFAQNTVFRDGKDNADYMLIGEAPGATEDERGIPFCGESGQLLRTMIELIGLTVENNAYITNTVFWRPPANRRPTSEEIEICRPFVEKHIALKKPKLIILVGGTATTSFLGPEHNISKIRSNIYSYKNQYLSQPIKTTAIFHPAYLLRQPAKKKDMWYDLLKIKELL